MAFSTTCQCYFTLLLLVIVASPLQTHARESKFFSKVSRTEPKTVNPKTEPEIVSASPSPSAEIEAATEQGYGLFGKEETYEYSPTTTNPTKSEPEKFKYVHPNWVKEGNNGYNNHYEAGEKQGMSDTRFMEGGRFYHDVNAEKKVGSNGQLMEEDDGHESYYGNNYENGNQYKEERYETGEKQGRYFYDVNDVNNNDHGSGYSKRNKYENENENEDEKYENRFYGTGEKQGNQVYGTGERQGMSDTRFLENGKYHYDINAEKNSEYNEDPNGVEFYSNQGKRESYNNYEKSNEYYEKQGNQVYGTEEKQGMSDTRFLENGKYYYDINSEKNPKYNEDPNGVEFYNNQEKSESYNNYEKSNEFNNQVESFDSNYEKENEKEEFDEKTEGKSEFGKGYDFRSTPNKFPNYEFDSIDEYEKYEQARSHQKAYVP